MTATPVTDSAADAHGATSNDVTSPSSPSASCRAFTDAESFLRGSFGTRGSLLRLERAPNAHELFLDLVELVERGLLCRGLNLSTAHPPHQEEPKREEQDEREQRRQGIPTGRREEHSRRFLPRRRTLDARLLHRIRPWRSRESTSCSTRPRPSNCARRCETRSAGTTTWTRTAAG